MGNVCANCPPSVSAAVFDHPPDKVGPQDLTIGPVTSDSDPLASTSPKTVAHVQVAEEGVGAKLSVRSFIDFRTEDGGSTVSRSVTSTHAGEDSAVSALTTGLIDKVVESPSVQKVEKAITELELLVDTEGDAMLASLLLEHLGGALDGPELEQVLASPVVQRLNQKLSYLEEVQKACCEETPDWFNVYRQGTQSIDGKLDKSDSSIFHYKVQIRIPASLTKVLAIANEIDMMPQWNKLVVGIPETRGVRTAHYMVLHYQMSMLGGLYKIDMLNEIRRYSDLKAGILAEFIRSAGNDHPAYRVPMSGFRRPQMELKNIWMACGRNSSVLIQVGRMKLPFTATKWLASTIGSVAGRFIVNGFLKNSMRANESGNPWESRLLADPLGFYARIALLVESEDSKQRESNEGEVADSPKSNDKLPTVRP